MKFKITIETETPNEVSDTDYLEWLRFQLGTTKTMNKKNVMGSVKIGEFVENIRIKIGL